MKKIILLATLLLASCIPSNQATNNLERYLDTLDMDYVVRDGECKQFPTVVYSFVFDNSQYQVSCRVGYEIIYLKEGYAGDKYFYLVYEKINQKHYFMNHNNVITPDGKLKTHQQYFGGK